MIELDKIVSFFTSAEVETALGKSDHARYLNNYLKELGAISCVIEPQYIDKDYTIDYQKFYCRSFKEPERETSRLHFFSCEIKNKDFLDSLVSIDKEYTKNLSDNPFIKKLNDNYLGFVVVRPIPNWKNQPLIGRTLLKTYPAEEDGKKRFFIFTDNSVSLFGIPLKIKSLPFQAKDKGVSACATIALWSALHPLAELFELPRHSPAEITEMATSLSSSHRRFPNEGLTPEQIINYINLLGLDMEVIKPKDDGVIQTVVKAFLHAGLPILASLKLDKLPMAEKSGDNFGKPVDSPEKPGDSPKKSEDSPEDTVRTPDGRHAVVISGYQTGDDGAIRRLYVHDDNVGPFCKVLPNPNFFSWKYQFQDWDYALYSVALENLKIPIYPKVRTAFWRIFREYEAKKVEIMGEARRKVGLAVEKGRRLDPKEKEDIIERLISGYRIELLLTSNREYKKSLLTQKMSEKEKILTELLPKYIWIVRLYYGSDPIKDIIYDSTSIYAEQRYLVNYDSKNAKISC